MRTANLLALGITLSLLWASPGAAERDVDALEVPADGGWAEFESVPEALPLERPPAETPELGPVGHDAQGRRGRVHIVVTRRNDALKKPWGLSYSLLRAVSRDASSSPGRNRWPLRLGRWKRRQNRRVVGNYTLDQCGCGPCVGHCTMRLAVKRNVIFLATSRKTIAAEKLACTENGNVRHRDVESCIFVD